MQPAESELLDAAPVAPDVPAGESADQARARVDRHSAWALLAVGATAFLAYNLFFVPRLTNYHFGDIEFSGWSGPMGSRILRGERPYIDFVLPIPPGSFLVLALLERLAGRALLAHELWLNTAVHVALGGLAYLISTPFTSRRNAALVACATWVAVALLWKECAYDPTAQIVSWASIATGAHALRARAGTKRARLWLVTGALSGLTLAFKQSTAIGSIAGWFSALAYLAAVEWVCRQRSTAKERLLDLASYVQGVLLGLSLVWLMLISVGSTVRAFFQAVFLDGSVLKGGLSLLLRHLAGYLLLYPAYPSSLGIIALLVLIAFRVVRLRGDFRLGDEPFRRRDLPAWEWMGAAGIVVVAFGLAVALLEEGPIDGFGDWVLALDRLKQVPHVGLLFLIAFIASHVVRVGAPLPGGPEADEARTGHCFNAAAIAIVLSSLLHNTSAPEFRPFYDNNPVIALSFLSIFVALDRAELRPLKLVTLALVMASLFTHRYYRAMLATVPASDDLHWAHLLVNERGSVIESVARRVRALTTPEDTVLVLPEDVQMTALIGRRRPPLLGAIVFVDQYAPRLAEDDIARLAEHPPKVIVIHPRSTYGWQRFFRIWSGDSGAERVIQFVLRELIPDRYRLDGAFGTSFIHEGAMLDVYVRDDRSEAARLADPPELPAVEEANETP